MLQKIKKNIKGIIAGIILAGSNLYFSSPALAQDGWANIQPAYKTKQQYTTVRLEGGAKLTDGLNMYGFLDADATREKPVDLENFYGEFRVAYSINDALALAAEYNGGNSCEDTLRLGVVITPNVGKGKFTMLKFFPYETSEKKGPQICLFTSQELTDKLSAALTIDYNPRDKTWYVEPEIDFKLRDNLVSFLQGRSFGPIKDGIKISPSIGIKYNF